MANGDIVQHAGTASSTNVNTGRVGASSDGVDTSTWAGAGTLVLGSTASGFVLGGGTAYVQTATSVTKFTYTSYTSATKTLAGCSTISGGGIIHTNYDVSDLAPATLASPPTVGNTLIICAASSATINTPGGPGTWTKDDANTAFYAVYAFSAPVVSGAPAAWVISNGNAARPNAYTVIEVQGTSSGVDVSSNFHNSTSTTDRPAAQVISTQTDADLFVIADNAAAAPTAWNPTPAGMVAVDFQKPTGGTTPASLSIAYKNAVPAGAYNNDATSGTVSGNAEMLTVMYKFGAVQHTYSASVAVTATLALARTTNAVRNVAVTVTPALVRNVAHKIALAVTATVAVVARKVKLYSAAVAVTASIRLSRRTAAVRKVAVAVTPAVKRRISATHKVAVAATVGLKRLVGAIRKVAVAVTAAVTHSKLSSAVDAYPKRGVLDNYAAGLLDNDAKGVLDANDAGLLE